MNECFKMQMLKCANLEVILSSIPFWSHQPSLTHLVLAASFFSGERGCQSKTCFVMSPVLNRK